MLLAEIEARANALARERNPEAVARAIEIVQTRASCSWAKLIGTYTRSRIELHRMRRRYHDGVAGISWRQIEAVRDSLFHLRADLYDHPCGRCSACATRKKGTR